MVSLIIRRHCNVVDDRYLVIVRLTTTHDCERRLVLEVTEQSLGGLPGPFLRGVEKLAFDPLIHWWHVILRGVIDDVGDEFPQIRSSDVKGLHGVVDPIRKLPVDE